MLKGDNKIICSDQGHFGIHSTSGTLTITGDGTLDIASARDCIQTGKIVVDGAKVHLTGFSGLFARLGETVLQNGVDVTLENAGNGYASVYGENGVHVKDSTLRAAGSFEESYAVTSPAEIVLDNANVKAESTAENAKQVMAAPNITLTKGRNHHPGFYAYSGQPFNGRGACGVFKGEFYRAGSQRGNG